MNLNAYKIEKISKQTAGEDGFILHFKINDFGYRMIVFIEKDGYVPQNVFHKLLLYRTPCPICGSRNKLCEPLIKSNQILFEQLIHHPSFRLRWVTEDPLF